MFLLQARQEKRMSSYKQSGFGMVGLLIVLVMVTLVIFAGWKVYESNSNKDDIDSNSLQRTDSNNEPIRNQEDLNKASEDLNGQDIDAELDTGEIDAALAE